jgi:hypothetical protein
MDIESTAIVQSGLSEQQKNSVAMGFYRSFEEQIETTKGLAGEWFTYFSFEDLSSDNIGFYLTLKFNRTEHYGGYINPSVPGGANDEAWRWLARVCSFPENRQGAVQRSEKQYKAITNYNDMNKNYEALIIFSLLRDSNLHVNDWGSPLLCDATGDCAGKQTWPAEFKTLGPTSPKRGDQWWFYDKNFDGELIASHSDGDFKFLK